MKKKIFILLLMILSLYITPVYSGDNATQQEILNSTPQQAVTRFTKLMFAGTGKGSNTNNLAIALNYIEKSTTSKKPDLTSDLLKKAKDLFFLLKTVNYLNDEIEVKENDGEHATIELGDNTSIIKLAMTYSKEHGWIFSSTNFTNPDFNKELKHIKNVQKNIALHSADFIPELSSPLNSLYTFIFGIQNNYGYTLSDSVRALNLSHLDPKVIDELGPTWAIQSYRMLNYASPVKPESLSNDPLYDGNIILLLDADFGMVSMTSCIDPESGKKAWKLGYTGANNINMVYDSFMSQGMVDTISEMDEKNLTLHIILDDFFQIHFPALEDYLFGMNTWKWILIILFIPVTLATMPLIKIIALPIINFLLHKFNITTSKNANTRFILPLQISIFALLWLEGIVIITANPRVMMIAILALNVVLCFTVTLLACRFIDSTCSVASDRIDTNLHILTSVIGRLLKVMILISSALYICYVFNIDTKSFLAALGIGGFAFALAGKDTIENFFGSIMIIIDRPFINGDVVKVEGIEGVIEQVGVRSTRLRTHDDSLVTIPNRMFISSTVENMRMRKWRRYKTSFNILYETDPTKIELFSKGLTELIRLHPDTRKDHIQVYLYDLSDSALQIYISLFFRNRGRIEELKARDSINTQALQLAAKIGIEFAYPTQKLYITKPKRTTDMIQNDLPNNPSKESTAIDCEGVLAAREISPYFKEDSQD